MKLKHRTFYHPFGEGRELMRISFSDSYVTHSFDFYIHPNFSIETVRQLLEDALLAANRKEDRRID